MPYKSTRDLDGHLYVGEFELHVLLAVVRLGDEAYGVTIREELKRHTGRESTLGAIYKTLERLEDKAMVSSHEGEPTPVRGGRRKRFYVLKPLGARAVEKSLEGLRRLASGARKELEAL
jgi:DNA-binding PadR family transcriptional regulator